MLYTVCPRNIPNEDMYLSSHEKSKAWEGRRKGGDWKISNKAFRYGKSEFDLSSIPYNYSESFLKDKMNSTRIYQILPDFLRYCENVWDSHAIRCFRKLFQPLLPLCRQRVNFRLRIQSFYRQNFTNNAAAATYRPLAIALGTAIGLLTLVLY